MASCQNLRTQKYELDTSHAAQVIGSDGQNSILCSRPERPVLEFRPGQRGHLLLRLDLEVRGLEVM